MRWWFFTNSDDFNVPTESDNPGDLDPTLLEQLGDKWLEDYIGEMDAEVKRILWEAVEVCRQEQERNGK